MPCYSCLVFVFVYMFRRENYFKIWIHCCRTLLVLSLPSCRYALYCS
ncbi:hypothetical protein LOK49_Contig103G00009 [Camellia lanceoleosa]|nr:hypothetical protein LOK49_Contig103G00009 [Camellia lanceoleosa]